MAHYKKNTNNTEEKQIVKKEKYSNPVNGKFGKIMTIIGIIVLLGGSIISTIYLFIVKVILG